MKPPRSTLGVVGTSVGVVAAGVALGAGAGYLASRRTTATDALASAIFTIEMGIVGAIATGFAGIVVAAANPKWREVGEGVALVGVGAPLVLATVGAVKQGLQLGTGNTTSPQTYNVTSSDSGSTVNMNVGDTLSVSLPSTDTAPTVAATGILATSATSPQAASTSGSSTTSYSFVATAAGTTTVSSGSDFTLTVTVA